jgi:hypothetical protein
MTLRLELTPEQERRISGAQARGIDVEALLKGLIDHLPAASETAEETVTMAAPASPTEGLRALFARWAAEDAALSQEERERENAEWEAFLAEHPLSEVHIGEPQV